MTDASTRRHDERGIRGKAFEGKVALVTGGGFANGLALDSSALYVADGDGRQRPDRAPAEGYGFFPTPP